MRVGLGDQVSLVAPVLDRFGDDKFRAAFTVHLRRVYEIQTTVEAVAQYICFRPQQVGIFTHAPGAEAKSRNPVSAGKGHMLHTQLHYTC